MVGLTSTDAPKVGELVRVSGQQWVVRSRSDSSQPRDELADDLPGRTLITLTSVSDDDLGDELTLVWEIEPGREVLPETQLSDSSDEVLTPQTRHPGFFDLLVVDEAHHCAPSAPATGRRRARESFQTEAVRRFGEHSQHRMFLSATPHRPESVERPQRSSAEESSPDRGLKGGRPRCTADYPRQASLVTRGTAPGRNE